MPEKSRLTADVVNSLPSLAARFSGQMLTTVASHGLELMSFKTQEVELRLCELRFKVVFLARFGVSGLALLASGFRVSGLGCGV